MKKNVFLALSLVLAFTLSSTAREPVPAPVLPAFDDPGWDEGLPPGFHPLRSRFATQRGFAVDNPPLEKRAALAREFVLLTPFEQRLVLRQPLWPRVRCADFLPVLEALLKTPDKPEQDQENSPLDSVIVALCDLHSNVALHLLLEDMKRLKPLLSLEALLSLPAEELNDAAVQEAFAKNLDNEAADLFKIMPLIARYGSSVLLPTVKARYQKYEGRWACSVGVAGLQFWIKHDPKEGLASLVRCMNERKETGCFRNLISETLPAVYSPEVEEAALPFLRDPDIAVALDAARTIARHGTVPGRQKLIRWLDQYPAGAVVKSISDQREWSPRHAVIWELSEGRAWPFDGHSHSLKAEDIALVRPLMSDEEWQRMEASIASLKQFDESLH